MEQFLAAALLIKKGFQKFLLMLISELCFSLQGKKKAKLGGGAVDMQVDGSEGEDSEKEALD